MFLLVIVPMGRSPKCSRGWGPPGALMGQAVVGPPRPLWAGPLWAPWALVGRALVGPPGSCGLGLLRDP